MVRCAVVGDPVDHSLSPALHRAAYAELGLDWSYDAVRVAAGDLASYVAGLGQEWRGLSLTMPLKREVVPLLTSRDAWTELSGVANTLLLGPEGGRHGLNTDIPGAEAALAQATGATLRSALVIGGGATAASVGLALCERGLERVTLVVRDPARASDTVAALARHPRRPTVTLSEFGGLGRARADVVVSTVPAAAQTDELLGAVGEIEVVFDVLYDPWPTPLAAAGLSRGHTVVGGLDLLVWQAVDQVRAMTGRFDVPVAAMRHAAEAALAARQRSAGR